MWEFALEEDQSREVWDTGLKRIRHEIRSRLVPHGLFATITCFDSATDQAADGSRIEITAKGTTVGRTFSRRQIEGCCLRVGGDVLLGIIAMVDEVSASPQRST